MKPARGNATSGSRPSERFSCLLLDDDTGFVAMLAKIVEDEGGEPVVCHTVAAARAQIAERTFALAILDNRLPDGSGYEFHAQLMRQCPAAVAVMITGAPELTQAVELTRNGLFDYLTKP
ncbi:MAG: response regulator, partial [Verrucomicrobia bacterium]|nr:response regulator [Verrucomicrobiota bacterium]